MKMKIKSRCLCVTLLILKLNCFAQTDFSFLTPGGLFDTLFDGTGTKYNLRNLDSRGGRAAGGSFTVNAVPTVSCSAGYFDVYYEPGSIWLSSVPMRTVLCQVLLDLSNFIQSPITTNTSNPRINLICGNINGPGLLATASSFYSFPLNPTNPNQGAIEGQIQKFIRSGVDPYATIPISYTSTSTQGSFYHGFVNIASNSWHTDIFSQPPGNTYDLYTVLLHEVTHALGFTTLINGVNAGVSIFGPSNNYYSVYDTYLEDSNSNRLLNPAPTSTCSQNNLIFTTSSLTVINPLSCNNTTGTDFASSCGTAVRFAGPVFTSTVYTPPCWQAGASLSHLEDFCLAPGNACPTTLGGMNNLFYAMANYGIPGPCGTKRFLKDEERCVLSALGYSTNVFYYSAVGALISGTVNSYPYSVLCQPTLVVGRNDGLVGGQYTYVSTSNTFTVALIDLLLNDLPLTGLTASCFEVIYSSVFGNNATYSVLNGVLTVNAVSGSGLVILKYYPINSAGQFGNATYVYVQFLSNNCNTVNNCNMIQNGGFENLINPLLSPQCGLVGTNLPSSAISCWENYEGFPALHSRSCTTGGNYNLGVATEGSFPFAVNSFNGIGNNRVISLHYKQSMGNASQAMKNNLSQPLIPTSQYRINFMALNATSTLTGYNNLPNASPVVITVATYTGFPFVPFGSFPANLSVLAQFTINPGNVWTQIDQVVTFTGTANHNALFIGINPQATQALGILTSSNSITCFIDQMALLAQPSPSFSIPGNFTLCGNSSVIDLDAFTSVPSIGVFSGNHVSYSGGTYNFNLGGAIPPGDYPIAYTYTTGGCGHTLYQNISVSTNTNYLALTPTVICANPSILSLSSLITNTALISGTSFSFNGTPSTVLQYTLATGGVYTISAINTNTTLNLCNYNSYSTTVQAYTPVPAPSSFVGTTYTNSAESCYGATIQLATNNSSTTSFQWLPGNISSTNFTVSPTVSTIYTLNAYNLNASVCPSSTFVSISILQPLTLNPTNLCITNPTLDLNTILNYTYYQSTGNFSVNGSASGTTYNFPASGDYTVSYSTTLCPTTATTIVKVMDSPGIPSITVSSYTTCSSGQTTLVATSTPTASVYSWLPTGYVGSTYVFTPTSNISLVAVAASTPCNIAYSNPVQLTVDPPYCVCTQSCLSTLAGTINSSPLAGGVYCVSGDLIINGAISFKDSQFKISTGVQISVGTGGTLTIEGSHLYACADMWHGILVWGSGALRIVESNTGSSSLIEDAEVAVYTSSLTNPHPFAASANIIYIDKAIFNKNRLSVQLDYFVHLGSFNTFEIKNSLFTSRNIPFTVLNWPNVYAVKNSLSNNVSALETPWINNSAYPAIGMKAPYSGQFPRKGISITNVAHSLFDANGVCSYTGVVIGEAGTSNFTIFDNLQTGIDVYRSNVKVSNAIFQNPRGECRTPLSDPPVCDIDAVAINANSPWSDDNPYRRSLEVIPAVSNGSIFPNYFYDWPVAVNVDNYLYANIAQNKIFSQRNTYPQAPWFTPNTAPSEYGKVGVTYQSNSFQYVLIDKNEFYNIRNNILLSFTEGGTDFMVNNGTWGRYIGQALVKDNFMNVHPSGAAANGEYINIGVSIDDPISSPGYTPSIAVLSSVSPSIAVANNTVLNAYNGIAANSFYGAPVEITSNRISLRNEPNTLSSNPVQDGILCTQVQNTQIHLNNISGPTSNPQANLKAIRTSMCPLLSIRCNMTENTTTGFAFEGPQAVRRFEDNSMENQGIGLLLDKGAILVSSSSALGTPTWPTNNVWLGTWGLDNITPPYKTYTQNSTAQNGRLYVQYGSTQLDPDGNGGTNLADGYDNYQHAGILNSLLFSNSDLLPECRIGINEFVGEGKSANSATNTIIVDTLIISTLKELCSDTIPTNSNFNPTLYIAKTLSYRTLASDSAFQLSDSTLAAFASTANNSNMQKLIGIEVNFSEHDLTSAISKVSAVNPTNAIEANYKLYYQLYLNSRLYLLDSIELIKLDSLANLCPFTDGGVVYQARALKRHLTKRFSAYAPNCNVPASRKAKPQEINERSYQNASTNIFPNPGTGNFIYTFNEALKYEKITYSIFDNSGREIQQQTIYLKDAVEFKFSIFGTEGLYLIKVLRENGNCTINKVVLSK